MDVETVTQRSVWWCRLRSRRKASTLSRSPAGKPQGIIKRGAGKTRKETQQLATKGHINRSSEGKLISPNVSALQYSLDRNATQTMPVSTEEGRGIKRPRHHFSNLPKTSSPQGVQKVRNVRSEVSEAFRRDIDTHSQELLCLPTPPRSQ